MWPNESGVDYIATYDAYLHALEIIRQWSRLGQWSREGLIGMQQIVIGDITREVDFHLFGMDHIRAFSLTRQRCQLPVV